MIRPHLLLATHGLSAPPASAAPETVLVGGVHAVMEAGFGRMSDHMS
jgi:hypothetical protein